MVNPDAAALKKVPLFAGLSDDERQKLASWLDVEEFDAGRLPARAKQSGYAFFILDEGRAHAELDGKVLEVLEPGAVFGEMVFFDPKGRRFADVVPDTRIRVFSMFGTRFREMQGELPDVAARLEQMFREREARVRAAEGQA
jgi:signal-transduction protein with cAMP-binding, CBS, and nucleotidyltransferase domain